MFIFVYQDDKMENTSPTKEDAPAYSVEAGYSEDYGADPKAKLPVRKCSEWKYACKSFYTATISTKFQNFTNPFTKK